MSTDKNFRETESLIIEAKRIGVKFLMCDAGHGPSYPVYNEFRVDITWSNEEFIEKLTTFTNNFKKKPFLSLLSK